MREIKFRAWATEYDMSGTTEEMIYMDDLKTMLDCYRANDSRIKLNDSGKYELMQYTGLKDMNGKEIYFDDIGKSFDGNPVRVDEFLVSMLIVSWITGGEERTMGNIENVPEFEIIGNIHENPELLPDKR